MNIPVNILATELKSVKEAAKDVAGRLAAFITDPENPRVREAYLFSLTSYLMAVQEESRKMILRIATRLGFAFLVIIALVISVTVLFVKS